MRYAFIDSKSVFVSGDGDVHCLIEYLEGKRKLLHVIIPNKRAFSALLRKFRPYFVFLEEQRWKLQVQKKKKSGSNLRTKP